jgi:hypothetical protein
MVSLVESILLENFRIRTDKILNYFWIGFILYTASYALATTTAVNYIVCQALQIIGILIFITAAIKLIRWKFTNQYLKVIFIIYCIWQLFIILRATYFDYSSIKVLMFDAELGLFRFFVPLILLFPKNLLYYKKTLTAILILGALFLLYDGLFIKNLMNLDYENNNTKFTYEHFVKVLSVPCGLILLTFRYQNKRIKYFSILVLIVSALFAIIRARRALLFLTISPLLFSYMLYLYSQKKKFFTLLLPFLISMFFLFYGIKNYSNNTPEMFSLLSDRATEDTRSNVEIMFYRDMNLQDWIIGKGIDGEYFCPGIETGTHAIYRNMIETDYLNIILKGGIISFLLLLMIAIPAFVKGLFYSENLLSKAAAIWIILWLLELYPVTVNTFSLHHLTFWIAIGVCYSDVIRVIPEKTLTRIFSLKKGDVKSDYQSED